MGKGRQEVSEERSAPAVVRYGAGRHEGRRQQCEARQEKARQGEEEGAAAEVRRTQLTVARPGPSSPPNPSTVPPRLATEKAVAEKRNRVDTKQMPALFANREPLTHPNLQRVHASFHPYAPPPRKVKGQTWRRYGEADMRYVRVDKPGGLQRNSREGCRHSRAGARREEVSRCNKSAASRPARSKSSTRNARTNARRRGDACLWQ